MEGWLRTVVEGNWREHRIAEHIMAIKVWPQQGRVRDI